jgi:hypothetical protein
MRQSTRTSIPSDTFVPPASSESGQGFIARYHLDHRNPVNHFLHVAVGWPIVAISILLLPFRPLWSAVLFVSAYAIMFLGHFVFERNRPTIFKHPSTPFVIALAVIRDLWGGLIRLARPRRVR